MATATRPPRRTHVPPYQPPSAGRPLTAVHPAAPPIEAADVDLAILPRVGLCLVIGGAAYELATLPREPGDVALRTWWLSRLGQAGDPYQVSELPAGEGDWTCTCADFAFRHEGNGTHCKHIAALALCIKGGLLAPVSAVAGDEIV
jgi:hypothetical protein